MESPFRVVAVIPARMASSRFPGKPLAKICGLPMVEHVRRRALLCGRFDDVVVATCDPEIAEVVRQAGGKIQMTSPAHAAATDRVAEAAQFLECTHIVNVQGDEVLVLPADLEKMASEMAGSPSQPVWNAVAPLEDPRELGNPSVVKCVVSLSERILFCSRILSGFSETDGTPSVRKLLGILGYRKDFLGSYRQLPRTPLEMQASVDQCRVLEHDIPLQGVRVSRGYPGVNLPEEIRQVEFFLERDPLQRDVLRQVMERTELAR